MFLGSLIDSILSPVFQSGLKGGSEKLEVEQKGALPDIIGLS
jgi:hypothetical protein